MRSNDYQKLHSYFIGPDIDHEIYRKLCRETPYARDLLMNEFRGLTNGVDSLDSILKLLMVNMFPHDYGLFEETPLEPRIESSI